MEKHTTVPIAAYYDSDQCSRQHSYCLLACILILTYLRITRLPSDSFSSRFPTKCLYAFLISSCALHSSPISSLISSSNNIWRRVRIMEPFVMYLLKAPTRSKHSSEHPFSSTLSRCSPLNKGELVSHSQKTTVCS
jgi:hypothetical protein